MEKYYPTSDCPSPSANLVLRSEGTETVRESPLTTHPYLEKLVRPLYHDWLESQNQGYVGDPNIRLFGGEDMYDVSKALISVGKAINHESSSLSS